MKKHFIVLLVLLLPVTTFAQREKGNIQLGVRSTTSLFSHDTKIGTGVGGQFRVQLLDPLNTEWFADYLISDLDGLGKRTDGHIGWSVLFYPIKSRDRFIDPYLIMGHCFDYTQVEVFETREKAERWSSAFQGGLGTHFNLSKTTDLSLSAQYMGHLGKDIHAEFQGHDDHAHLHIHEHESASLEGHLLVTVSFNIKVADLW